MYHARRKATFFYMLDYVTLWRISKYGDQKKNYKQKLNLNHNCAKLSHVYQCYFHRTHVDQVGGEFQPKMSINMQLLPF